MTEVFEQADFSGFLKKKGGSIKAFRRRWFELRNKHLYYFKQQNNKKPAGVISLANGKVEADPSKKLQINISGTGLSRVYELQAETEQDFKLWFDELKKAVSYKPENDVNGLLQVKEDMKGDKNKQQQIFGGGKKVSLEDFEPLVVIGRGSFGKVLKVKKRDTGEIFAMKVLRKDVIVKENMISHTKSEKQILQDVEHPFIVRLHFAFQTEDRLYLVLDFLSGGELFFHLKEHTKFDVERAKFYTAEIVLAIEHLHNKNIIYRDLKPENIVLNKEGHVCMTDFGLAKTNISNDNPTHTFCGTPEYLAPEILKGQGHAKAVDWWSLGILLYEMLVGLPPFYSENINEMYELILKAPLKFPNSVPADAQSLLRGLLERDESKRLGGGRSDASEIKSHPFFASVDWNALFAKKIKPPFVPQIREDDTKYFDDEFTREKLTSTVVENVKDEHADFGGFDYDSRKK